MVRSAHAHRRHAVAGQEHSGGMMASSPTKTSFPILDQWRALAALAVLAHHFNQQYAGHDSHALLHSMLSHLGPWGVSVFFVLSGFCIHWGRLSKPGSFSRQDHAMRRFFRIYPAFVICLLVSYVLGQALVSKLMPAANPLDVLAHLTLLSHFSMTQRDAVNNVLWSVVAECYFYGLYGLLFRQFNGVRQTALTTAMAMLVAALTYLVSVLLLPPGPSRVMVQNLFLASWWTWCLGALVAELVHRPSAKLLSPQGGNVALALSLAASLGIGLLPGSAGLQAQRFLLPITSACLLYAVLQASPRHPVSKALVSVGLVSYSLYLFHPVAISLVFNAGLGVWSGAALTLMLSLALAYLGHRWIEQPGVRWGQALALRLRQGKAPLASRA